MARVALATYAAMPQGDEDDAPLPGLIGDATWAVWDDPAVDWDAFDLVVLRSTWDYQERRDAFLAWVDRLGDRLLNPPGVVRWNTDKRYLAELPHAVETAFLAPGEPLADLEREVVVKPTVSAGSRHTARFSPGEEDRARALVAEIHGSGRTAMVQPYVASVDARGETALLFFDGAFSHAVTKAAILKPGAEPTSDDYASEEMAAREATAAEREVAGAVLAAAPAGWLYARVDLVEGDDGRPLLLELELTEPSLFLGLAPGAAERFAAAVRARLR